MKGRLCCLLPLAAPSAPPRAVTVTTVKLNNSSSVSVSWEPPPSEMQNGIIQEYRVNTTPEFSYRHIRSGFCKGNRFKMLITEAQVKSLKLVFIEGLLIKEKAAHSVTGKRNPKGFKCIDTGSTGL